MATSFQNFKFVELYALIQSFQTCLLFLEGNTLTDTEFLYSDFSVLVPFTILASLTPAANKLTKDMPSNSLFTFPVLFSVTFMAFLQLAFQLYLNYQLKTEPFYEVYSPIGIDEETGEEAFMRYGPSQHSTMLFWIGNW